MRDIARLTYADHVRLAEALNHSPQVLNNLVGRWAQGIPNSPASPMDVATAMSKTPAYRGYFKESADG